MRPVRAATVLCFAIAAACTSAPASTVVPSATTRPNAIPTVAASPTTEPRSQAPTLPTPAETPRKSETPAPTALDDYLIDLAHPDLRHTCAVRDQIYDAELSSITCGPDDLPFDYSLFETVEAMNAAFDEDVAGAETPPDPQSPSCSTGRHLSGYSFDEGEHLGRQNCREHTSSSGALYHVLEWTSEQFLVIGYISNLSEAHTWDELVEFWQEKAGPIGLFD